MSSFREFSFGCWNGINRVFSRCRLSPYFSNRLGSTSITFRASFSSLKTMKDRSQMCMVQGIEELPDIDFQNPAPTHRHSPLPERI